MHRDRGYKVGVQGQSEARAASPNFNWNDSEPGQSLSGGRHGPGQAECTVKGCARRRADCAVTVAEQSLWSTVEANTVRL